MASLPTALLAPPRADSLLRSSQLSRVLPYVCRGLAERRLMQPDAGDVFGTMLDGALLFADISGFTTLAEQLARNGREGAEELTLLLNEYFDTMVDLVADRDGDILQFGGDSLLAAFGATPACEGTMEGSAAGSVRDAVQCGLDMQAAMSRFERLETSAGAFGLRMSIGVHRGPFLLASAGAWAGRVQQVAMGGTLNRLAEAEALAQPGEVLVTCETADLLADWVVAGSPRSGCVPVSQLAACDAGPTSAQAEPQEFGESQLLRLDSAIALEELLRPYLIPAVYRRAVESPLGTGGDGEHRFIATMFVHFDDLSAAVDRAGSDGTGEIVRVLNAYLAAMSQAVERHGGTLARVSSDARGDKLLVLFGAPLAVENPQERAVRCAFEMQRRLAEFNAASPVAVEQRIGITSGSAFCANVGSERRREYTVISDGVNTAARLMAAAGESQVLVSESVRNAARQSFRFESHGPLRLKGKADAVDVYRLASPRDRRAGGARWKRKLIGRETECARFRDILERVQEGTGQVAMISGEPGVGKTRLLEEFVAESRRAGMRVLRGECLSAGQSAPWHAWSGVIRDLAGTGRRDATAIVQAKLVAHVAQACPAMAAWSTLLGDVLGIPWPDSEATSALNPRQRMAKIIALCLDLLRAPSRAGSVVVVVMEDIHWIDVLSRELLAELSAHAADSPLLVIATHRPGLELHETAGPVERFDLDPLTNESSADLVRVLLDQPAVPERLVRVIVDRAQGNPLYVEELVRALGVPERGSQTRPDGRYLRLDPAPMDLPGTIQGLVLSRVDALSEDQRQVLHVASVFGRTFPRQALGAVLPPSLSADRLGSWLDELSRAELVVREQPGAAEESDSWTFRHALIQEAVYESLSYARRREIHAAIGAELERTCGNEAEEQSESLARHFDLARVPEKAFVWLARAGDRARRSFANAAAADYYGRALACSETLGSGMEPERRLQIRVHLADALALTGDYAAAVQRYEEALEGSANPVERARLEGKIGGVCYRQGQPASGIDHLTSGLAHLGIRLPHIGWPLRASLLRQALTQAAHTLVPRLFVRPRSRNVEATRAAIEIYESLSRISYESDLHRTLDAHLRQLNLCETLPDSPEMAQTYSSHGIVCGMIPLLGRALRYQRKGLAIRESHGDAWGVAQSLNFMGVCYYQMGRGEEARDCLQRSAAMFDEIGDRWETEITYLILSFVALRFGELPQAGHHARTMLELSRRADDSQGMGWALGALADACCKQGSLEQALGHARQALACSQRSRDGMYVAVVRRTLGAVYLRMGDRSRAIVELEGAVRQIREERLPHEYVMGAYAALAEARLAHLGGSAESQPARRHALREIRRLCRTAVARGRKFKNWLPEAYRVSALWAWAADRPRAAQRFLERSLETAEALGARYELAMTCYHAGRHFASVGDPSARAYLERSRNLFAECGAALDRDRAQAVL